MHRVSYLVIYKPATPLGLEYLSIVFYITKTKSILDTNNKHICSQRMERIVEEFCQSNFHFPNFITTWRPLICS